MAAGEKEKKHLGHIKPYSPQSGTMVPMGAQKFFRTCVIFQLFRFIVINFKMMVLIAKSHH
ncbi:MAG: hypothetical protein JXQ76_07235 [Campylobacterales bacterium]|jgi:hypothetical protein|nr:hypothetical protein [Campylobacterales bacterium]